MKGSPFSKSCKNFNLDWFNVQQGERTNDQGKCEAMGYQEHRVEHIDPSLYVLTKKLVADKMDMSYFVEG